MNEWGAVASAVGDRETKARLRQVVKPTSVSRTLRKAGVALILAPDPITAVPGAMMLGASFVAKQREPLNASSVFEETRRLLAEMGSLF
jgi:hypothetical protein